MSRSPFLTVLALGLGALPYLLTAFIGGVLADRVDRARLLASIYCAKALVYALIWEMWVRFVCLPQGLGQPPMSTVRFRSY